MAPDRRAVPVALLVWVAGCAPRTTPPQVAPRPAAVSPADSALPAEAPSRALPPVPEVRGPLALRVVYPPADALVRARDSSFLFGSAGTGLARLTVNDHPVRVWPNGAWLAWVALPDDSLIEFRIEAWTAAESALLIHSVRRAGWRPPPPPGVWIDTTSFSPSGPVWWPREEYLTLGVRASEGAEVRLRLPDGTLVPLAPAALGKLDGDTAGPAISRVGEWYAGVMRGRPVGPDPGPVLPAPSGPAPHPLLATTPGVRCASTGFCAGEPADTGATDSLWAVVEAVRGVDTVRSRWPLQLGVLDSIPLMAELDDDPSGVGDSDSLTVGRALPGGTYHWFFPTGTRTRVSARAGSDLRLRLAPGVEAWVAQADAGPAPAGPTGPAVAGSVTLTPLKDRVLARVPLGRRLAVQVEEGERSLVLRLYGAVGDVNWIRYGRGDPLVRQVRWAQEAGEQVTLTFELSRPVWGYRVRWEDEDLVFEIRRPLKLDEGHPLRGRLIALDPGHPPAGATGPTGLREAEANLGVALELREMLEEAGARVLMTRTTDLPLDLWRRVKLTEAADADLLVSVHNNALPDGVNPFTHSGSSVYYNHPRSVPLARLIQEELVSHLKLPDLGIGRGDLALVRATWMPSVLTEGLFMMLPDQESALRTVQGRRLYASAVFHGIRRFLRARAKEEE